MGAKNPDRFSPSEWRAAAPTVGAMIDRHWDVQARCRKCGLVLRVDLRLIAAIKTRKAEIWNRTAPCRKVGCNGVVDFEGKPPILYQHMRLAAEWPTGFVKLRD
jgi:hypothetical protein